MLAAAKPLTFVEQLLPLRDAGKTIGFTPAYLPAEDFGALIASDDAKLAQVMGELGLKKK